MVASDTLVGIVGAVVLVAVMAGVFVYEYNNPTTNGSGDMSDKHHLFMDTHPALNATDDIDQDGIPNVDDDDLDGDGIPNGNDTDVVRKVPTPGNRPQVAPGSTDAGAVFPLYVGEGAVRIEGTLTYNTTTPSPAPADKVLSVVVRNAEGQTVAAGTATRSGTTVTVLYATKDAVPAGNYTIVVSLNAPATATAFNGAAFVHYPAPMTPDHKH
jgi:hypothetical protein